MSTLKMYSMTSEDLTQDINNAVAVFLSALETDGLLTKPAIDILGEYAVVVCQKGFFGKVIDKLRGMEDNNTYFRVVRVVR